MFDASGVTYACKKQKLVSEQIPKFNDLISYQTEHDSFYSLSRPLLSKQIILSNIGFFFYSFLSIQTILPLIICKY